MQLPGTGDRQVINCPIALSSIVLKRMLNNCGTKGLGYFNGAVFAIGVHDEDLVRNLANALQRCSQCVFGIESE